MKNKKENQFQAQEAVIDPNLIPEQFIRDISSRILKVMKTDKSIQKRYEQETGKQFFKWIISRER